MAIDSMKEQREGGNIVSSDERTWADGYGNWFTRVPQGFGSAIRALGNITEALAERHRSLDLGRLSVRVVEEDEETVTYVEAWTVVEHTFEEDDRVEIGWILDKRGPSHVSTILRDVRWALESGQPVRVLIGEKP